MNIPSSPCDTSVSETTHAADWSNAADAQPAAALRTHYRAPRGHNELLLIPDLTGAVQGIQENREQFNANLTIIGDRPLAAWREHARRECVELARSYLSRWTSLPDTFDPAAPLILAGHQPELFHPGVWVKNILIDELARRIGGISLNVVIDSDTVKSRAISLPVSRQHSLSFQRVVVDEWRMGSPWQELHIVQPQLFATFAERARQNLAELRQPPVLADFWDHVQQEAAVRGDVVSSLIAGRRAIEESLGVTNLEVPISLLAETQTYREFAAYLIREAVPFRQAYNQSLREYRQIYHLKSDSHPIPDLTSDEGWTELPLWTWTAQKPRRRGLFVKQEGEQVILSNRTDWTTTLEAAVLDDLSLLADRLGELGRQGVRIRTRALMTTLFLRLFVSDWFIHGIGGAKYDEITDALLQRYWKLCPPQFQVATGTIWLPLKAAADASEISSHQLQQLLRRAEENPEILLEESPSLSESEQAQLTDLLREKQELQQLQYESQQLTGLTKKQRRARRDINRQRYLKFQENRSALAELAASALKSLRSRLATAQGEEHNQGIASHREYPFVCYPWENLSELVDRIRHHD